MTGIALLEMVEDLPQGGGAEADQVAGKETFIEVLFGKAKKSQVEVSAAVFTGADRVGLCDQVTFIPVAEDKPVGAEFLFPVDAIGGGEGFGEACTPCRGAAAPLVSPPHWR